MRRGLPLLLLIIGLGSSGTTGAAQTPGSIENTRNDSATLHTPNIRPTLAVTRAAGPIELDGHLDDAGWVNAARARNFTEFNPRNLGAPSVDTEAWVTYDDRHLYVAIIARDDPTTLRSSLTDHDRIGPDDFVGIMLDTYGDAAWGYFLFANPRGIQFDARYAEGRGEDDRVDLIWASRGRVTEDGYVVEIAVPFASLRFPPRDVQNWRVTFWRNRPRANREQISWAALSHDDPCMLCQFGYLTGIEGVRPGGSLELLPSVVGSQAGALGSPGEGFVNQKVTTDAGITARYSFASGLTAEATINPDFSQVESDAGQVNVNSTFALFFPERRAFFQEGSDLFSTWFNAVYTRSINNPLVAGKLIGRMGRTTLAYLGARDEQTPMLLPFEERSASGLAGKSVTNVVRARQTFGRNSHVGGLLTDRRLDDGGSGTLAGVDAMLGFGGVYGLEFQLLGSRTIEPDAPDLFPSLGDATFARGRHTAALDGERFSGYAQYTSFERNARTWSFDFDYWAASPTFRADNGFETRNDFRRVSMFQGLTFYPNARVVKRINPNLYVQRTWNFAGDRKLQQAELRTGATLTGQTFAQVTLRTTDERFRNIDFTGMQRVNLYAESNFSRMLSTGAFVGIGDGIARNLATPVKGNVRDLEWWVQFRPSTWARLSPSIVHSRMTEQDGTEIFEGYILRTRADLQFTRELFLRMVVEYNNFGQQLTIEPLLTYRANPFTMVYLGSTRGYRDFDQGELTGWTRTSTQYFTKVQYLLRR